jgi:saccharopine dehydrogenase (NADP+, L-glutamate forming)
MFETNLNERIKEEKFSSEVSFINITDFRQCDHALRKADLVIAILPDVMLLQVVDRCLIHGKSLISPSRLTRQMMSRRSLAEENNTLILMECGFSPGLDHITAKKAIDNILARGGRISSFKTFSGSLIADGCVDNPWEYKLTEPVSEVINMGKHNNRHIIEGKVQHIPYYDVFNRSEPIKIEGLKNTVAVPIGDSLYYRKIYQLTDTCTVMKGKVLRKGFDLTWNKLVRLGLTEHKSKIDMMDHNSFYQFMDSFLPYSQEGSLEDKLKNYADASDGDIEKLKWLGLLNEDWIAGYKELTPSIILQFLMERKFSLKVEDKDCIIMQHQLEYANARGQHQFTATLVAHGENQHNSAIAKAIGLTTGAAAKSYLIGNIKIKGLHIPTKKEIYDPILNELDDLGVAFQIEEKKKNDLIEFKGQLT